MKPWNEQEIDFLIRNYEDMTDHQLAQAIGRSQAAIKGKLGRMKLHRTCWGSCENRFTQLSDIQRAYFAGHFDGEGCVLLRKDGTAMKTTLLVTGCHLPTIEEYRNCFGGTLTKAGKSNRQMWRWSLRGIHECKNFIDQILPYSREKKEQLDLLGAYIKKRLSSNMTHPPARIKDLSVQTYTALRELKKFEYCA